MRILKKHLAKAISYRNQFTLEIEGIKVNSK